MGLRFIGAVFDDRVGLLVPAGAEAPTGTMVSLSNAPEGARVPALPERCPRCDARGINRDRRTFFRGVVRSPIRAHTTGTARISQVLLDRVG
jgi:DEAD/DEAH box helicase domain-containing protein